MSRNLDRETTVMGRINAFDLETRKGKEPPAPPPGESFQPPLEMSAGSLSGLGLLLQTMQFDKSTTQIAQGAIQQLLGATPAVVQEGIRAITNKRLAANQLLNYLERRTRVGEVLNEPAKDWNEPTPQDFAEAFQMSASKDKFPVMDTIVSIAILNDPNLRGALEAENTTEPSTADLMQNRRIVWQWPEPGTPFTPPYVMMVAVEHQDTRKAESVIQSILGDLVEFQGFKLPRETVKKL